MLTLHDIHDVGEFPLFLNVQLLQVRLEQLPSLIVWHVGIRRARSLGAAFHVEVGGMHNDFLPNKMDNWRFAISLNGNAEYWGGAKVVLLGCELWLSREQC